MNKQLLLETLLTELNRVHQVAVDAVKRAHATASDKANIPENKYDTLALEAGYLAQGQSKRVEQCAADIQAFEQLNYLAYKKVQSGALVLLLDESDKEKWLFFGPAAGGLKVEFESKEIIVVTASSPLGKAINQAEVGQEVTVNVAGKQICYEVLAIY
ncbi:MAG: transcription elongation factor [Psychromonas sp.]|nr:transcription elongation factor [Alteromonadales bacterium]MCP5079683.1 transcription elongation factor [Psychromonas sp.]